MIVDYFYTIDLSSDEFDKSLIVKFLINLIFQFPLIIDLCFWLIWSVTSLIFVLIDFISPFIDFFFIPIHIFINWFYSILFVDDPILLCRYPGVCPGLQVQEESCLAPRGQPGRGKLNQSFLSWSGSLFSGFLYSDAVPVFNAFLYLDPYSMAFCTRIRIRNTDPGT